MGLQDKIRGKLKNNSPEERKRREGLLAAILEAHERGGPEDVTAEVKRRLKEMERELNDKLDQLRKKF
jgi:hypothetical protein